jgi:hypothetical protein
MYQVTTMEARQLVDFLNEEAIDNTNSTDEETVILEFRRLFETSLTDDERNTIIDLAHANPILGKMFTDFWGGLPE